MRPTSRGRSTSRSRGATRTCAAQFGNTAEFVRGSVLTGSTQEVVDRIGEYADAGADQINVAMRAPFDVAGLERFAAEVLPQFTPPGGA